MSPIPTEIPDSATTSVLTHRIAFHETDAMGVMHHANYLKLFEEARVLFLLEHDRPYTEYMAIGRHFAVTHVHSEYLRPARFDQLLDTVVALQWVAGASAGFVYQVRCGNEIVARGATAHAMIDEQGRPRRIPPDWRKQLLALSVDGSLRGAES